MTRKVTRKDRAEAIGRALYAHSRRIRLTPGQLRHMRERRRPLPEDEMTYDSRPATHEHIAVVRGYLSEVIKELLDRAQNHDASKLVDPERETFDEYTPKLKHSTYGTDEYKGFLVGMGEALKHHYASNRHHPEHHADGIEGMNLMDLVEMICDWLAAVQRHDDGDIRRSIDINQERFGYDDQLKRILHNTVDALDGVKPHAASGLDF